MSKLGKNGSTVLKIMQTVPNFPQIMCIHPRKLLENDGEFFFFLIMQIMQNAEKKTARINSNYRSIFSGSPRALHSSTQDHRSFSGKVKSRETKQVKGIPGFVQIPRKKIP